MYLYLAGFARGTHQDGCRPPLHGARIGIDGSIANDLSFAFDGENNVLLGQAADMSQIVGHLGNHHNKIRTVGHKVVLLLGQTQTKLRGTARRHLLGAAHHSSVDDALGIHVHHHPVALGVAVRARFPEIPHVFENHGRAGHVSFLVLHGENPLLRAVVHGQAYGIAVAEHHNVRVGERPHLVHDVDHRAALGRGVLQVGRRLAAEHIVSIFRLAETVEHAAPIGVGMVAALVVERMPVCAADELAGGAIKAVIGLCQRKSLHLLRTFAPAARRAVVVVVRIPVVHILAKLTGEDALFGRIGLLVIARPAIHHVVVFGNTGRMDIGSRHGTSGIWVFVFRDLQCLQGEVERIARLVQDGFPHQHGRVIAVAADDVAGVLMHTFGKLRLLVPILPSRSGHDDKQAQFVTRIHERRILRIMGHADDGTPCIAQQTGVAPLLGVGHGIAHVGKVLMAVGTHQLPIWLAIEEEPFLAVELKPTDAHTRHAAVDATAAVLDAGLHPIQIRRVGRPQLGLLHHDFLHRRPVCARLQGKFAAYLFHHFSSGVGQRGLHRHATCRLPAVLHIGIDIDLGALLRQVVEVDEHAAIGHLVCLYGIRNGHRRLAYHPHVAVDAAMISKVKRILCFSGRIALVIAVVGHDGNDTLVARLHSGFRQRNGDRQIAAQMFLHQTTVDIEFLLAHDGLEVERHVHPRQLGGDREVLAIPRHPLIVTATAGFGRHQLHAVRGGHDFPIAIVEVGSLCPFHIAAEETPSGIKIIHLAPASLQGKKSGNRNLLGRIHSLRES